tara:strand:+ start:484 stop:807 length:324 start_codon:yes stop_codon:yes gene_type:complete
VGFVPTPFVHTSLEVFDGERARKVGFYPQGMGINFFGLAPGEVREEASQKEGGVVVTKDDERVRALVKAVKDVVWARYHPLKKNCFHWRNTVLQRAGIAVPKDSWVG